jgi:hypothetical protein
MFLDYPSLREALEDFANVTPDDKPHAGLGKIREGEWGYIYADLTTEIARCDRAKNYENREPFYKAILLYWAEIEFDMRADADARNAWRQKDLDQMRSLPYEVDN